MKTVHYTNTGKNNVHIGLKRIQPGETREVDASLLDNVQTGEDPQEEQQDEISIMLDASVPEIIEAMQALSAEDYSRMKQAEVIGKQRKGLLDTFAEEDLRRASAQASDEISGD